MVDKLRPLLPTPLLVDSKLESLIFVLSQFTDHSQVLDVFCK
jgi:hypothetical protein